MNQYVRLLDDIEAEVQGEAVEGVVLGAVGDTCRNSRPDDRGDEPLLGWAEARGLLEERLRNEYGSFDGRPFWVWTATRVLFLAEYDGRWRVASVPRSPQPGRPIAIGGDFVDAREEAAG